MEWQKLLACIFSLVHLKTVLSATKCPTHVSGYHGTEGIISCFIDDFQEVYWFEETKENEPLIRLQSEVKSGRGHENGENDILPDGSLVIKNITFSNDQQYKVLVLDSEGTPEPAVSVNFSVIGCDNICPPANGQVTQNASWAQFTCDDGFHLGREDSDTLECLCESGVTHNCSWSDLQPTCGGRKVLDESSTTATNVFSTLVYDATTHTTKVTERSTTMSDIAPDPPRCVHIAFVPVALVVIAIQAIVILFLLYKMHSKKCDSGDEDRTDATNPTNEDDVSATNGNKEDDTNAAAIPGNTVTENQNNTLEQNPGQSNATSGLSTNVDERAENESIEMKERNQTGSNELSKLLSKRSSNRQEESD